MSEAPASRRDFFISYTSPDRDWGEWIAWTLEEAGYTCVLQAWDFEAGCNFLERMDQAVTQADRVIAVLSEAYTRSAYGRMEWTSARVEEVRSGKLKLLPIRVASVQPTGLLGSIAYVDMVGVEESKARDQLLEAVAAARAKPKIQPPFPQSQSVLSAPAFPGTSSPLRDEPRRQSGQLRPAGEGMLSPCFAHPYPLHRSFVGRTREREFLTQWLLKNEHPILVLTGIGGVGKSSLAWVWANRDVAGQPVPDLAPSSKDADDQLNTLCARKPSGMLWWSFYEGGGTFHEFLETAVAYCSRGECTARRYMTVTTRHGRSVDYAALQADLVQMLRQEAFLLIWDGVERLLREYVGAVADAHKGQESGQVAGESRDTESRAVQRFWESLAAQSSSHLLVVGRILPRALEELAGVRSIELMGLLPEEAADYLTARGIRGLRSRLTEAAAQYEHHPLALSNLAAHLLEDFEHEADIAGAPQHDETEDLRARHHHVLELAYEKREPRRQQLLSAISAVRGCVEKEIIALLARHIGIPEGALGSDLDELVRHGLLRHRQPDVYDFHPIVKRYCYNRLTHKQEVHRRLYDYFRAFPATTRVEKPGDLAPLIECCYHGARTGLYDEAGRLYLHELQEPLFYRFGAHGVCADLLRNLFPNGEGKAPALTSLEAQASALDALGRSYAARGYPRKATSLFRLASSLLERAGDDDGRVVVFGNLGKAQMQLGMLKAASESLGQRIAACVGTDRRFQEAVGQQALGLLLSYEGQFGEAQRLLDTALLSFERLHMPQSVCVIWCYRALLHVLMGQPEVAVRAAEKARALADEVARRLFPHERDFIRAEWLLGISKTLNALGGGGTPPLLVQAKDHMEEALVRCHRSDDLYHEARTLLARARWHQSQGDRNMGRRDAKEGLAIADRCEFRLLQADAHNFLAQEALSAGELKEGQRYAIEARERATCDGLPHAYVPALDEAERLLERSRIVVGVSTSVSKAHGFDPRDTLRYAATERFGLVQVHLNELIVADAALRNEVAESARENGIELIAHAPGPLTPDAVRDSAVIDAAKDVLRYNQTRVVYHFDEEQGKEKTLDVVEGLLDAEIIPCIENYHAKHSPRNVRQNYTLCRELFHKLFKRNLKTWAVLDVPRLFDTKLGLTAGEASRLLLKVFQVLTRWHFPILLHLIDTKTLSMSRHHWCPVGQGLIPYAKLLPKLLCSASQVPTVVFEFEDKENPLASRPFLYQ